jgi:hypothetical protein
MYVTKVNSNQIDSLPIICETNLYLSINRIYYSGQKLSENSHQHFEINMMLLLL